MRILLGFENLLGFGGTETYTLTVAKELDQLGHDAAVYSPNRGVVAEFAHEQGVRTLSGDQLPPSCEVVIACDAATCHELASRYPGAVVLFVAHSADHLCQAPPRLADRCAAVVVLNDRVRRAVEARGWHAPIVRLRQPIDLLRFTNLGAVASAARTALVSTNYFAAGPRAMLIEGACRANGLSTTWIGATTEPTATPEFAIAGAELVIGLGRTVLEGMAAGRAAYVLGVVGGDGWVTPERYPAMEADGFAGTACPELVIDRDRLTEDLAGWEQGMGEVNRDLASAHHSAREHAIALIALAQKSSSAPLAEPSVADELAHLIRLQWRSENRALASQAEAARLRALLAERETEATTLAAQLADASRLGQLLAERESEAAGLRARLDEVQAQLGFLRHTRRYRLASRLAAPLDRMRDVVGTKR